MNKRALIRLVAGLLLSLGLSNKANSQTATPPPPSDSVCVPKYQMDFIMADLDELDERRATGDSAHKAVLTIKGQNMQLNVDNGQLRNQNNKLKADVQANRGQVFRETVKTIGSTTLKVGAVVLALWWGLRHL